MVRPQPHWMLGLIQMKQLFLPSTLVALFCLVCNGTGEVVEKWKQFRKTFVNQTWTGNPYDLSFFGIFTSPTGKRIRHYGFYGGRNDWRIYFMPNELGHWKYKTFSSDGELDGLKGEFDCVESSLKGMVVQDPDKPNRWMYSEGGHLMPILWGAGCYRDGRAHFRGHGADNALVIKALKQAEQVGATWLHTCAIVLKQDDWAKNFPVEAMPYVPGKEGKIFNSDYWDNLNSRLDKARDLGMGHYVMLYTDDGLRPDRLGIAPGSREEMRLYRYVMARISPYPIVLWDTGIDISEYRNADWINAFTDWFIQNDPWSHPVSSRHGGGSGNVVPANQTYESLGGAFLPTREHLLSLYRKPIPTAHTDHWRIFISRGRWNNDKIRKAIWRCALTGGQAPFPDYSQGPFDEEQFLTGKKQIAIAMDFIQKGLRYGLGDLEPDDSIVRNTSGIIAAINRGKEVVVFNEANAEILVNLSSFDSVVLYNWLDTKNGRISTIKNREPSQGEIFPPPEGYSEPILHIFRN